jgi:hypothetical protein
MGYKLRVSRALRGGLAARASRYNISRRARTFVILAIMALGRAHVADFTVLVLMVVTSHEPTGPISRILQSCKAGSWILRPTLRRTQ